MGSIAWGAFTIAVVRFIKFMFYYTAKKFSNLGEDNAIYKCLVGCGTCCLNCIEKVCDYLTEAGFCYMAVTGDHFFKAAWNGFLLNLKHGLKFTFANSIAKAFIFLGKVVIVFVNCGTLLLLMKFVTKESENVNTTIGPVILVGLVTYIAADLFLSLFEQTVMAICTCLSVDMDLNGGKPIYGPKTFHDG